MEWLNDLSVQAWSFIALNAVFVMNFAKTFITDVFNKKKLARVTNFTAVANQSMNNMVEMIPDVLESFKTQLIKDVVVPLKVQLSATVQESIQWKNIAITSIALANVPLDQKKEVYAFALKATDISKEVVDVLAKAIASEEQSVISNEYDNTSIENALNSAEQA